MGNKILIIMKKNLLDNFSIIKTSLYVILILAISYFSIFQSRYFESGYSFLDVQANLISQYFTMGFFFIVGIPYLLYLILLSAGVVSKEIDDGTFLLIFSRPVKRIDVLFGKFLGIFSYLTLVNAYILFTLPSLGALFFGLSKSTLFLLYEVSITLFLYGLLVTLFTLSLVFAFSSKFKKIVLISIALFIIVSAIFITPMVINMGFADMKTQTNPFASLGVNILERFDLDLSPDSKVSFSMFTGTYVSGYTYSNLYSPELQAPSRIKNIPSWLSVTLTLFLSSIFFLLSYLFIRRREIY